MGNGCLRLHRLHHTALCRSSGYRADIVRIGDSVVTGTPTHTCRIWTAKRPVCSPLSDFRNVELCSRRCRPASSTSSPQRVRSKCLSRTKRRRIGCGSSFLGLREDTLSSKTLRHRVQTCHREGTDHLKSENERTCLASQDTARCELEEQLKQAMHVVQNTRRSRFVHSYLPQLSSGVTGQVSENSF